MLGFLSVTAFFGYQAASSLRIESNTRALLADGTELARALDELHDTFGRDKIFVLQIRGEVFSEAYLRRLAALHSEL